MTPNDVSPRWVGSGWTVFNNKGKPVRQYEPFFTDTHRFEFDVRIGVSPVLFYDPVERVVATLHPNHTWEKVVFDPWRQETWDVNDTVLVADPKTDADVGDFFSRLPNADYLPTWHALRTDAAHAAAFAARYPDPTDRANETRAAEKTRVHAATPTVAHADSLGRTFLTVAHNKFKYSDTPPADPPVEEFHSHPDRPRHRRQPARSHRRQGPRRHALRLRHARQPHPSGQHGGGRALDAERRRGQAALRLGQPRPPVPHRLRPAAAADGFLPARRRGRRDASSGAASMARARPNPEASNLRGKVVELRDQAGVVTSDEYDFKGNLLRSRRRLAQDVQDHAGLVRRRAARSSRPTPAAHATTRSTARPS